MSDTFLLNYMERFRQYSYYENALKKWTNLPLWLNQEFIDERKKSTDDDNVMARARYKISDEIIKMSQSRKTYNFSIQRSGMTMRNIMDLAKELNDRFDDVKFRIPGIRQPVSTETFNPIEDHRPTSIVITFF